MNRSGARAAIAVAAVLAGSVVGGGTAGAAAADGHGGGRAVSAETWITVPNVVNESEPDAVAELTLLGFHIHTTVEYTLTTCDSPVPPPDVAEQAPEGGNLVLRGANISLSLVSYMRVSSEC